MKLHSIKPKKGATKARRPQVGRGNGSGHGTYSGRGCKGQGQHASGGMRPGFEGGQTPLVMRLPKLRGFRNPTRLAYRVVNVGELECFKDGSEVTPEILVQHKLIRGGQEPVKVLGDGSLTKKLTIKVHAISAPARDKVVRAGGKVL